MRCVCEVCVECLQWGTECVGVVCGSVGGVVCVWCVCGVCVVYMSEWGHNIKWVSYCRLLPRKFEKDWSISWINESGVRHIVCQSTQSPYRCPAQSTLCFLTYSISDYLKALIRQVGICDAVLAESKGLRHLNADLMNSLGGAASLPLHRHAVDNNWFKTRIQIQAVKL